MCTLSHVHLRTSRIDEMLSFYRDQLCMPDVFLLGPDGIGLTPFAGKQAAPQGETFLLAGEGRKLLITAGDDCALEEIGLLVQPGRWAAARKLLKHLGAHDLEAHAMFRQAMVLTDPEGNRVVFGSGTRVNEAVIRTRRRELKTKKDRNLFVASLTRELGVPGPSLQARLQHFGLGSSRIAELVAFYQNKIGFALSDYVTGEDRKLRSTFLRGTDEHHLVAIFANGKPGLDHFSFEAPDWNGIRDWADHFARFDTKIFWGAGRHGVGNNLFIFVLDPDGNMVEISAELETVPFGRQAGHWAFDYKAFNLWGPAAIRV